MNFEDFKLKFTKLINDFDILAQKIKNKRECTYQLTNFTNVHGIPFDKILFGYSHGKFECDLHQSENFRIYSLSSNEDFVVAINTLLTNINHWNHCQKCELIAEVNDNLCHDCQIVTKADINEKFECCICAIEQLNTKRKKLPCGHDVFCSRCLTKCEKLKCPLCRRTY